MVLNDEIRDRIILVGGKVGGVDCPACQFNSREINPDPFSDVDLTCPECGTVILTEGEKRQLQSAHKL